LEFNVPFQHKYGYIRDDNEMEINDWTQTSRCPDWLN